MKIFKIVKLKTNKSVSISKAPRLTLIKEGALVSILKKWLVRAKRYELGHIFAAKKCQLGYYLTGVPTVILYALISTLALSCFFPTSPPVGLQYIMSLVAVLSLISTAIHKYINHKKAANLNHSAAIRYGSLRFDIEVAIAYRGLFITPEECREFGRKFKKIRKDAPIKNESAWNKADKHLSKLSDT